MTTAFASNLDHKARNAFSDTPLANVALLKKKLDSLTIENTNTSTHRQSSIQGERSISDVQSTSVIPVSKISSWQLKTIQAIGKLAELPENWDSYGSRQIQKKALAAARHIVRKIDVKDLPAPRVYPVAGGGIQLEWCILDRELEIEILPDASIQFLTILEDEEVEEGSFSVNQVEQLRKLVHWLITK